MNFKGKTVLITGASNGIGKEIALSISKVVSINYLTGKEKTASFAWNGDNLQIEWPRKSDPVIYFGVRCGYPYTIVLK